MKIHRAVVKDIIDITFLLREIVKDMNAHGWYHWNTSVPSIENITKDIRNKEFFIVKNMGVCIGMVSLTNESIPEYDEINWHSSSEKVLYVHRLGVHPIWKDRGVAALIMEFAEDYAQQNGFKTIRMDAYSSNKEYKKLISSVDFSQTGEFFYEFQKTPFVCYEKSLQN